METTSKTVGTQSSARSHEVSLCGQLLDQVGHRRVGTPGSVPEGAVDGLPEAELGLYLARAGGPTPFLAQDLHHRPVGLLEALALARTQGELDLEAEAAVA